MRTWWWLYNMFSYDPEWSRMIYESISSSLSTVWYWAIFANGVAHSFTPQLRPWCQDAVDPMRLLEENLAAEEEKKKADLGLSNNRVYDPYSSFFSSAFTILWVYPILRLPIYSILHRSQLSVQSKTFSFHFGAGRRVKSQDNRTPHSPHSPWAKSTST